VPQLFYAVGAVRRKRMGRLPRVIRRLASYLVHPSASPLMPAHRCTAKRFNPKAQGRPELVEGRTLGNNKHEAFTPKALHNAVTNRPTARDAICETPLGFVLVPLAYPGCAARPWLWS
jgi:hypothetical protein